jgi:hypothetical protein
MLVFPQLSTGAAALFPFTRRASTRTVVNSRHDGGTVTYADPDWSQREWELRASGLTEDEFASIEELFGSVSGRLGSFTFLDPAGNLLSRSQEFDSPEWNNDALISLTPGMDDPNGGTAATRVLNGSGLVASAVAQTLGVPGWFRYSLSVWARSTGGAGVTLFAASTERGFALDSAWKRISMAVDSGGTAESVTFGARIAAAEQVDLFGMQVDGQPAVSSYKRTAARGGVYPAARFGSDALVNRALGTDVFESVIRVVSK